MPAKLRWREFTVNLPDFSEMSDSDLALVLAMQDGPWHPQTKAAAKRFRVTEIELNSNWAEEHCAWRCPICDREKKDIFRITESGALKACLEIHHDHLEDYVKHELRLSFGAKWSHALSSHNRHLDWITAALLIRFSETLVCSDCNEVDGRIKSRMSSVDRHFSFSPSEIAACIAPHANASHQIDFEIAKRIWDEAKADFDDRKNLLRMLLDKVEAGGLKREEVGLASPRLGSSMTSSHLMNRFASEDISEFLNNAVSTIAKRSVTKADVGKRAKKKRRAVTGPTKEDLAQLVYGNGASKKWDDAPTNWSCPICERTKLEVARRSNSKKWFAGIYEHVEWFGILVGDEPYIDRHERIDVCADCAEVFSELMRKKPALSDSFLTAEQIGKAIDEHGPHQTHEVDWEEATRFATENLKWEKSKKDYWPRYHQAKRLKRRFDELQRKLKIDDNATLDELAKTMGPEFPGWEWHELLSYLHDALEDANRWPDR
jgi:rubredoxin